MKKLKVDGAKQTLSHQSTYAKDVHKSKSVRCEIFQRFVLFVKDTALLCTRNDLFE